MKGTISRYGYKRIKLYSSPGIYKTKFIHVLVAENFIPNIHAKLCVNHKDGNKLNNHYSNLEWCSHSENTKHSYDLGLQKKTRVLNKGELKLSMDKIQELIYEKTVNII